MELEHCGAQQVEAVNLTAKLRPELRDLQFSTIGGTWVHDLTHLEVIMREGDRKLETRKFVHDMGTAERMTPPP